MKGIPSTQVIIAALNEEEGIGHTIYELNKTLKNTLILVVDGKSTDQTIRGSQEYGCPSCFARWIRQR